MGAKVANFEAPHGRKTLTKKFLNKRIHLMSEEAPVSACGRYLPNFPGMIQTFDPSKVTCAKCEKIIAKAKNEAL